MAEAMAPRGPDAAGVWSQGRVALGHRRLKIIDLSEAGAQPMVDSDLGLSIGWNGCIYNYQDLRRELTGHGYRFFSHSDTEVLLKAYHHWGDRFVDRLKGMFAFAIVERDSGRVLLGRDRFGIKPLYLTEDAHRIRFASSLPRCSPAAASTPASTHRAAPLPVVPLGRPAAPHDLARRHQGAAGVACGDRARFQGKVSRTTTTYWEPDFTRRNDRADWSERDWEDAVLASLRVAVERRLVADVPSDACCPGASTPA